MGHSNIQKGLHHLAHKMLGTTPRKKCFRTLKEPADEKHSSLERYLLLVFFVVFLFLSIFVTRFNTNITIQYNQASKQMSKQTANMDECLIFP